MEKEKIYDSIWLSEVLGLQHNHTMQKIKKLEIDLFEKVVYKNSRNRQYDKYIFNFEGLLYFFFNFEMKHKKSIETIKQTKIEIIKRILKCDQKKIIEIIKSTDFKYEFEEYKTYIMYCDDKKLYKIGKSIDVLMRKKAFETAIPKIKLIFSCDYDIENALHKKLKFYRKEGEWFDLEDSIIDKLRIIFNTSYSLEGFTKIKDSISVITNNNSIVDKQLKKFSNLYNLIDNKNEIENFKKWYIDEIFKTI